MEELRGLHVPAANRYVWDATPSELDNVVQIEQLVFGRLEPAFSPQEKSGFQVVYRSPALSDAEVNEIEKRINVFTPHVATDVRRQFFTIGDQGSVVLTHTTLIEPDTEIVDRTGRAGAFVAHCLIISQREFAQVWFDPFRIFDAYPNFVRDGHALYRRFVANEQREINAVYAITIAPPAVPPPVWESPAFEDVLGVAMTARNPRAQRPAVLVGDAPSIDATLRLIFAHIPPNLRPSCTFDTLIDGRDVIRDQWWVVGATRPGGGGTAVRVDTRTRRITGSLPRDPAQDGNDMYIGWLLDRLRTKRSTEPHEDATARVLAAAIDDQYEFEGFDLHAEVCADFLRLYRRRIMGPYEAHISKLLGPHLGAWYLEQNFDQRAFTDYAKGIINRVLSVIRDGADEQAIAGELDDLLLKYTKELSNEVAQDLLTFADAARNDRLSFFATVFPVKAMEAVRIEVLREMENHVFRTLLTQRVTPPPAPSSPENDQFSAEQPFARTWPPLTRYFLPPSKKPRDYSEQARNIEARKMAISDIISNFLKTLANEDLVAFIEYAGSTNMSIRLDGLSTRVRHLDRKTVDKLYATLDYYSYLQNDFLMHALIERKKAVRHNPRD